jgi:quinoprotein relay system zinc metallohydrolase 2
MNRREAMLLTAAAALAPIAGHAAATPFPMHEVAPGIHVRVGVHEEATPANEDGIANIGFIVGNEAVAVIDPGGSRTDGERLRASVASVTDRPVRYVVQSHVHPDHVFGAAAFLPDKPVFVGHARMPAAFAARGDFYRRELAEELGDSEAPAYVVPTMLVTDTAELDLGGRMISLKAHATAHTDNDLSVFDMQTATLWAADLLFVTRVPSVDGSLLGWLREIAALKAVSATRAVPGHGPPSVPWPEGVAPEERYLRTLERELRALMSQGGDIETAVATVGVGERANWVLFDSYNGRNVTAAFKELEWE